MGNSMSLNMFYNKISVVAIDRNSNEIVIFFIECVGLNY